MHFKNLSTTLPYTVGNRMDEIPRSDFFKKCFWIFCSIVNTLTKKKPQHVSPCYLPVFRYLPSKSKFCRIWYSLFAAETSTLEADISGLVQILFSMYIPIQKVHDRIYVFSHFLTKFQTFWLKLSIYWLKLMDLS